MAALPLAGYELSFVNLEESCRVTVKREGREVAEAVFRAVHDLVPFHFVDGEARVTGLASRNGKNVALSVGGALTIAARNPEFRKIAARLFTPGPHLGWTVYSLVANLVAGFFVALAIEFGLFSSLAPVPLVIGGLAAFAVSYAIDLARDRKALAGARAAWATVES